MTLLFIFFGCPEPIVYQLDTVQPPDSKHMVRIVDDTHRQKSFWIDAFEYPNVPNQRPLASTSFSDAQQSCKEVGKRLCTAQEWRRACIGSQGLRFGYGNAYETNRCHTASSLASGHTSMMQAQEYVVESGSKQHCQSEGVFDMIGNLEEWVLDDWQGRAGSLEGGAWYTYTEYADCSGMYSRQPDYRTPLTRPIYSAGFRCCWTPEPPTKADITYDAIQKQQTSLENHTYNPDLERELGNGVWMDIFEYPNQPSVHPTTNITWTEAKNACQESGKRLCTVQEWELGCGGNFTWPFPYGDTVIDGICNIGQQTGSKSGTFLGCQSALGLQDMVGSVWEWTDTTFEATVLKDNPNTTLKEIRGGSWFVESSKGTCTPSDGYPLTSSEHRYPDVGFRCCRGTVTSPVNSTTSLLSCPNDMSAVEDFCVDQFEFPNIKNVEPIADATFSQAIEACSQHGKHLCTDTEWTKACQGSLHQRWPYGDSYIEKQCNDHGWIESDTQGAATPSGHFANCRTSEGIFDMSGNLWEWTDANQPTLRGGSWQLSAGLGQCRSNTQTTADYHAGEVGFRCCATTEETQRLLNE